MLFTFYYLDFLLVIKEIVLTSLILFSLCIYTLFEKKVKPLQISLFYSISIYFIIIFNLYLISAFSYIPTYYYLFNYTISNIYGLDYFRIILIILIILIFFTGISEKSFKLFKTIPFEANYILSFLFLGMLFLLYSFDFLSIFLNLELQNFALYILMNIQRNKKTVVETCIKYYIIGGISSAFILYGISLLYGITGKVNLFDLILFFYEIKLDNFVLLPGLLFFFIGLLIKLGLAPFHFWVPQIYDGAPNLVTLILLILPKFILFLLLIKLYFFVFKFLNNFLFQFFLFNVCLSFFFGSLGALWQTNIKKFLAYSAINNSGFILLSFILFTYEGLFAAFLYLIVYLFSTFSLFFTFLNILPKQTNKLKILDFKNFNSVKLINPFLILILSINFLSLAGIPPLSGFISKMLLFAAVIQLNYLILIIILILTSLISAYYYIRPIKLIWFQSINKKAIFLSEISYSAGLILTLSFFFNLFLICQPNILISIILTNSFFNYINF